jgi:hypothetical protein
MSAAPNIVRGMIRRLVLNGWALRSVQDDEDPADFGHSVQKSGVEFAIDYALSVDSARLLFSDAEGNWEWVFIVPENDMDVIVDHSMRTIAFESLMDAFLAELSVLQQTTN